MNVRTVFGVLAWMLSSSLDASEVSSLIAISADGNPTTYLLSEVQRINVSAKVTTKFFFTKRNIYFRN